MKPFNQALYHDRGQYANINNLRFDSNNGIWISHSHAVAYINGARGWSYYNSNTNWSKSQYVVGNVADDGSGHIKVTVTTAPSTIAAGDIIKIDSVSGYYGVNNRWRVASVSGSDIVLLDSQSAPSTTGTWANGARVATLNSLNSLSAGQTITGTGIGPSNTNTINAID